MDFSPGAIGLGDIIGGTLGVGIVPYPRFIRTEHIGRNAVPIVFGAGPTSLISADIGTVVAGDRILSINRFSVNKGVVQGATVIRLVKRVGTATCQFYGAFTLIAHQWPIHGANLRKEAQITGMVEVLTGGTLTLELDGQSLGSNDTINANECMMFAWVIPGS